MMSHQENTPKTIERRLLENRENGPVSNSESLLMQKLDEMELMAFDTRFKVILQNLLNRSQASKEARDSMKQLFETEIIPFLENRKDFKSVLYRVLEEFNNYPKIQENIVRSLAVPQAGPHHNEGDYMVSHLNLIFRNLKDAVVGKLDNSLDEETQVFIREALCSPLPNGDKIANPNFIRYIFLHDIAKADCLRLKSLETLTDPETGKKKRVQLKEKEVTWDEWMEIQKLKVAGKPYEIIDEDGTFPVTDVSYYHKTKGREGMHGRRGVEDQLKGIPFIAPEIKSAIDNHEIAYEFADGSAEQFKKHFPHFTDLEQRFIIAASYTDSVSSLTFDGKPDLGAIQRLFSARKNYLAEQADLK